MPESVFIDNSVGSSQAGGGNASYTPSGVVNVDTTQTGTDANQTEKTLWQYSLPANSLNTNGRGVRITATGSVGTNGNAKTIRLYFGTTVLQIYLAGAANNLSWRFDATVIRTGAAAQISTGLFMIGGTATNHVLAVGTESLTAAVVIKVTGQNGANSANDIVFRAGMVEFL